MLVCSFILMFSLLLNFWEEFISSLNEKWSPPSVEYWLWGSCQLQFVWFFYIGLPRFISSWKSFGFLCLYLRTLSISSKLSKLLHRIAHSTLLILLVAIKFVVMSYHSFLLLVIPVFSPRLPLVGLGRRLSILFISKNQYLDNKSDPVVSAFNSGI